MPLSYLLKRWSFVSVSYICLYNALHSSIVQIILIVITLLLHSLYASTTDLSKLYGLSYVCRLKVSPFLISYISTDAGLLRCEWMSTPGTRWEMKALMPCDTLRYRANTRNVTQIADFSSSQLPPLTAVTRYILGKMSIANYHADLEFRTLKKHTIVL